jgi:hypothetical protein
MIDSPRPTRGPPEALGLAPKSIFRSRLEINLGEGNRSCFGAAFGRVPSSPNPIGVSATLNCTVGTRGCASRHCASGLPAKGPAVSVNKRRGLDLSHRRACKAIEAFDLLVHRTDGHYPFRANQPLR